MYNEREQSSEELYERFRQGDKGAFEELVMQYRQGLTLFIHRYVNDMDTAEDIAEDVFVKLLVKKPPYKGNASFKTWLFTVGKNLSLDLLRKHRRVAPTEEEMQTAPTAVEDSFFESERKRTLYRALNALPKEERLLMQLIYIEDLSYDHAEKILGVSKKKLYAMSRKAKETLREELIKEGTEL